MVRADLARLHNHTVLWKRDVYLEAADALARASFAPAFRLRASLCEVELIALALEYDEGHAPDSAAVAKRAIEGLAVIAASSRAFAGPERLVDCLKLHLDIVERGKELSKQLDHVDHRYGTELGQKLRAAIEEWWEAAMYEYNAVEKAVGDTPSPSIRCLLDLTKHMTLDYLMRRKQANAVTSARSDAASRTSRETDGLQARSIGLQTRSTAASLATLQQHGTPPSIALRAPASAATRHTVGDAAAHSQQRSPRPGSVAQLGVASPEAPLNARRGTSRAQRAPSRIGWALRRLCGRNPGDRQAA